MESTVSASGTLGAIGGVLAGPAPKTRRRAASGSHGTTSRGRSISNRTIVGAQSTSRVYAREAIVEAMSDVALVELVLADDQDAFSVLVERYKDAVQNLAYRMLGNATEAEDVTQETFVRAYTQLATYGPEQSALEGEQQDEIQVYLQRLPGKYRAVIVLRYWYDFSYEEISRTLHLTPALVKARLHRARELLARYMKQNSQNEEEQIDALQRR